MFRSRYFAARYFSSQFMGGGGTPSGGEDAYIIRIRRRRRGR